MSGQGHEMEIETGPGALAGLLVIDLSRVLGGPYCTQILGDHGAEVLKVEPPQGDETRGWGPPFEGDTASYFMGVNRNKKGLVLDLRQAAAREALLVLLEDADVLVENFKTGTLEKWGLDHDLLSARFPRLVHCRISGFGADGPLGGLPGYDAVIQAMAGLMSVNGEQGGEPLRVGLPVVDMVTGLNAAVGILLALNERERSGRGQFVETALGLDEVVAHPHTAHREMLVRIGDYRGTGSPIKLERTPATYRLAPPAFGEHTQAEWEQRGITLADSAANGAVESGAPTNGAAAMRRQS